MPWPPSPLRDQLLKGGRISRRRGSGKEVLGSRSRTGTPFVSLPPSLATGSPRGASPPPSQHLRVLQWAGGGCRLYRDLEGKAVEAVGVWPPETRTHKLVQVSPKK